MGTEGMSAKADVNSGEARVSAVDNSIPLQKYLARAGIDSRRKCENHIRAGRVGVNGVVVTEMGVRVVPGVDSVSFDGRQVAPGDQSVVLMLNKPAGYVTTMSDEWGRPIAADLVPVDAYPGLFPVGRLDQDTTGLLLFTNDGELGQGLLHPTHHVDKTYEALVRGVPSVEQMDVLRRGGLVIANRPIAPARVELLSCDPLANEAELSITIHEGRKRQVRKMCKAIHHPVIRLNRRSLGPLELGDLALGRYRLLSDSEIAALRAVL